MKLEDIKTKTTAELVAFYNAHSGRPVIKKFADRPTAEKRVGDLVKARTMHAKTAPAAKANDIAPPKAKAVQGERGIVHAGSNRMKVLEALGKTPVSAEMLMKAVYGSASKEHRGPLMMVINGLTVVLAANGRTLKKERIDGTTYFSIS